MFLNLSCFNSYSSIPSIPVVTNPSSNIIHSPYKSSGNGLIRKIVDSSFPLTDIEIFSKIYLNKDGYSLNMSTLLKTKSISSILTYTIICLLLFLILCCIFYIISYFKLKKFKINLSIILILMNLFLFIWMIFIIIHVYRTDKSLHKSLTEINNKIYPQSIVQHLRHLIKQFEQLDEYAIERKEFFLIFQVDHIGSVYNTFSQWIRLVHSISVKNKEYIKHSKDCAFGPMTEPLKNDSNNLPNSIVVVGSKSILKKALNRLLKENYFIEDFVPHTNNLDKKFQQLNGLLVNQTKPPKAYNHFINSYKSMMSHLIDLNEQLCDYTQGTDNNVDQQVFNSLEFVHEKIQFLVQFIVENVLTRFDTNLFDKKQEEKIHRYISLVKLSIIFILIFITIIPAIFIAMKAFLQWKTKQNIEHPLDSFNIQNNNQRHFSIDTFNNNMTFGNDRLENTKNGKNPYSLFNIDLIYSSRLFLNLMRIIFGLITILILILCLMTGLLYGLDLLFQGSCRILHNNHPYLLSLAVDDSDMNERILSVINDCNKNVHFSEIFLKPYFIELNDELNPMIEDVNRLIFEQFSDANDQIENGPNLPILLSLANSSDIKNHLKSLEVDLNQLKGIFKQILTLNSTIPLNLLTEFELFLKKVIQSTIDSCPLPMDILLKTDQMICHETAKIINGLWFSLFLFMFAVILTLYIFGLCVYKQFD